MSYISWIFAVGSFLLLCGRCAGAAEFPGAYPLGLLDSRTDAAPLLEPFSPTIQVGKITGRISSYDGFFHRLSITNAQGKVMGFSVDSNTPILDIHDLQIGFDDLRSGDRVTVQYNVEALWVNRIDKI